MFRAAVLSIVLTLAAGQNASLAMCSVVCHPREIAVGTCEHHRQTTSRILTGNDDCTHAAAEATALIREDLRPGASAPGAPHAVVVRRFWFAPPPTHAAHPHRAQAIPLEARPLTLSLRI